MVGELLATNAALRWDPQPAILDDLKSGMLYILPISWSNDWGSQLAWLLRPPWLHL